MTATIILGVLLAGCAFAPPRVLLLGEVHDNADGHQLRYARLRTLVDAGLRPAIAMEQFDRDKQAALSEAQASCPDADCVIAKAGGGKGWNWDYYRPVIELALRYKLPLLAANVSRADARRVAAGGLGAALDAPTIAAFGLAQPLPAGLLAAQEREIAASHCGQLPPSIIPGMALAQVARDVWMAKTVADHAEGVVLLAGNAHVRRDIGAGRWLRGFAVSSEAYLEKGVAIAPAFDVVHLVAPQARADPCATMLKTTPQQPNQPRQETPQ